MHDQIHSWFSSSCGRNFKSILFKFIKNDSNLRTHCEIGLRWMSQCLVNGKSLVQLMVWCRQPTSHHLVQSWPRFVSPYDGVTMPQWVKSAPDLWYKITHLPPRINVVVQRYGIVFREMNHTGVITINTPRVMKTLILCQYHIGPTSTQWRDNE